MYVGITEGIITRQSRQAEAEAYRLEKLAGQSKPEARVNGQVVVIGGGMAGLAAAHVASRVFSRVTIVERDEIAGQYEFRPGVPQARHTHNLLPEGLAILERLFPGIISELILSGGVPVSSDQQYIFSAVPDRNPSKPNRAGQSVYASRPLLESTLYRRLAFQPEIHFMKGWDAAGIEVDSTQGRVSGVRLRRRGEISILPADLILDTSGRNSKAPRWLADAGYEPPYETRVDALTGYASRFYARPAGFRAPWKMLYIPPSAPDQPRGGIILPLEGNRWHVTLFGMAGDYPPTDEDRFLDFTRGLASNELYEAIRAAEPLSKPAGYRLTQNRRLHYEKLPRYLEGLLIAGDAAMALNPVYAQGMSKALVEVEVLEKTLSVLHRRLGQGKIDGLARSFQAELSRATSKIWRLATDEDSCWPETVLTEGQSLDLKYPPVCRRKIGVGPRSPLETIPR